MIYIGEMNWFPRQLHVSYEWFDYLFFSLMFLKNVILTLRPNLEFTPNFSFFVLCV